MSQTTIDQLFQISTPSRSERGPSRSDPAGGDLFRKHLNRAADAAEPKPLKTKFESKLATIEEDEPLELPSGQQETSTAEQEQAATTTESSEPSNTETAEESSPDETTNDEVTLSVAAAAQQTEPVTTPEQITTTVANGQQPSSEQPSSQPREATDDSAAPTTGTETLELEADLLGKSDEIVNNEDKVNVDAEVEINSTQATLRPETGQLAAVTAVEGEAKKSQSVAASTSASTIDQQPSKEALEALPESETSENSSQTAKGRLEVPAATATNDLTLATEAELALANTSNTFEATANAPNPTAPSTADTVAAAGRTLGNLLAGKTATAASDTSETSTRETPTVDRARFVQRVGGAIRSAQQRDGQIQLRLSPPELGTLRIQIVLNEGVLTAHLETETAAARAVLLDNLPALRERLAEQDIRIEKFDVDVGREGQQQTDDPETDDRQANRSRSQTNQPSARDRDPSLATAESNPAQPVTASGLDVRI